MTARRNSRIRHPFEKDVNLYGAAIRFVLRSPTYLDWTRIELSPRVHIEWRETLDSTEGS